MNKKYLTPLVFVLGVVIGIGGVSLFCNKYNPDKNSEHMMHNMGDMDMKGSMDGMVSGLSGKKGDVFDRAFLELMIVHHEGAVEMARQALVDAKHQEIKDLSNTIITAQEKEIKMMKEWLEKWYK